MKTMEYRSQVVVIYANEYKTIYNSKNRPEVVSFARSIRSKYKKEGALKVITNYQPYESTKPEGEMNF